MFHSDVGVVAAVTSQSRKSSGSRPHLQVNWDLAPKMLIEPAEVVF
jgi:hypothetical protein